MRPETVRRLLVLGVCAGGVGALYLVPSVGGVPSGPVDVTQPDPAAGREPATNSAPMAAEPIAEAPIRAPRSPAGRSAQTARHTATRGDVKSPTVVTALRTEASRDRLLVRWSAAEDDVAVAAYVVELNGYAVAETQEVSVSVPWFKGLDRQLVRVAARDAAGNVGEPAALLVQRPPTATTAQATPAATPTGADPGEPVPTAQAPTSAAVADDQRDLMPSASPSPSAAESQTAQATAPGVTP